MVGGHQRRRRPVVLEHVGAGLAGGAGDLRRDPHLAPPARRRPAARSARRGAARDNDDGSVLDHTLVQGNPADAPQLVPAVERVIARTGRRPRIVTADRGYGEKSVEDDLHDLGVSSVAFPARANRAPLARLTDIDVRSGMQSNGGPAARSPPHPPDLTRDYFRSKQLVAWLRACRTYDSLRHGRGPGRLSVCCASEVGRCRAQAPGRHVKHWMRRTRRLRPRQHRRMRRLGGRWGCCPTVRPLRRAR
ncbi:MAG: transposase [Frankiaceae bacterium]